MGCGASVPVEYEAESDAGLASLPEERPKRTVYGGADDELSGDANEGGDEKADDEKDAYHLHLACLTLFVSPLW